MPRHTLIRERVQANEALRKDPSILRIHTTLTVSPFRRPVDIDANTVLGIDNLNPNDRILHDTWDGGGYLESSQQMKIYAYEVARLLFSDLGIAPNGEAYETAANLFHMGMVNAAQTLKAHKGALTARRNGQPHGVQKVITLRLERRLDRILSK